MSVCVHFFPSTEYQRRIIPADQNPVAVYAILTDDQPIPTITTIGVSSTSQPPQLITTNNVRCYKVTATIDFLRYMFKIS